VERGWGSIFWKTPDTALYSTYISTWCLEPIDVFACANFSAAVARLPNDKQNDRVICQSEACRKQVKKKRQPHKMDVLGRSFQTDVMHVSDKSLSAVFNGKVLEDISLICTTDCTSIVYKLY
jgi:hypothetical protein